MLAGAALAVMILIATLALLTVAAYFSGQSKEEQSFSLIYIQEDFLFPTLNYLCLLLLHPVIK